MKKAHYIDNPVFICGHRRTGTTLFISLLENHPQLLVYPPDSGFFYAYYPIYEDLKYTDQERKDQIANFCINNLDEFLRESFSNDDLKMISFDCDGFRTKFYELADNTACSSKELLIALIEAYHFTWKNPQKPLRWVEKTTSSEIYASEALKWFPEAKFVHIIRDPRDNWASLKSGWENRFKHYNDSIDRLMHSMIERGKFGYELSLKNRERFGENIYKVIRYEDLVANTSSVMKDVCEFLEIQFSEAVLTPSLLGNVWQGNNYGRTKFKGASSQNVSRWRERISEDEAMLIEYHFEDFMKKYKYTLCYKNEDKIDAAVDHYKWYNYNQVYSYTSTQDVKMED